MKTVKEIREAKGLSQEQFAKYLGISRRSYQGREFKEQAFTIRDIVRASMLNDGLVQIETDDGVFDLKIVER